MVPSKETNCLYFGGDLMASYGAYGVRTMPLRVQVDPDVKLVLSRLAEKNDVSLSNLVDTILSDFIRENSDVLDLSGTSDRFRWFRISRSWNAYFE